MNIYKFLIVLVVFPFSIISFAQDIVLGYRALYDDYDDGTGNNRFVFDAWMYGPIIGLNFNFYK